MKESSTRLSVFENNAPQPSFILPSLNASCNYILEVRAAVSGGRLGPVTTLEYSFTANTTARKEPQGGMQRGEEPQGGMQRERIEPQGGMQRGPKNEPVFITQNGGHLTGELAETVRASGESGR